MYTQKIALALAPLLLLARADLQLDNDDVPSACRTICRPVVELSNKCEVDLNGDDNDRTEDRLEAQCVCTNDSFNVSRITALCADCMRQHVNDGDDDDDDDDDDDSDDGDLEDINDIMYTCGFASSSYASASSTLAASITVVATAPTASSQLTTTIVPGATNSETGRQVTTTTTLTSVSAATSGSVSAEATSGTESESSSSNTGDSGSSATGDSASTTESAGASATDNAANALGPYGLAGAAVFGAFVMLA